MIEQASQNEPPLPHLIGEKMEESLTLRFIRGIAFVIVGGSIILWEVSNIKHATSTALTTGVAFVGMCLMLLGVYEVEQWKNKVVAAKAKRRKENAE